MNVHDYRNEARCWGHDLGYRPLANDRLKANGWGRGLSEGDYLLLSNGDSDTRYAVEHVRYFRDPSGQWSAVLVFAPRPATPPAVQHSGDSA